jgi:putative nucleotidyltransferase with HDIG domain
MHHQVLFVDDDLEYLSQVKDSSEKRGLNFSCHFVQSAKEALQVLTERPFDLIVSDLDMPEMNGELLLQRISYEYPDTLRFVLTGRKDSMNVHRFFGVAQQVVAKDQTQDELFELINSAIELKQRITNPDILHCLQRFDSLPMIPQSFLKISELLRKEDFHQRELLEVITRDMTLSAEVLRIANSAFFGSRTKIASLEAALNLLGVSSLKNIVIFAELFKQPTGLSKKLFDVNQQWEHAVGVANITVLLSKKLGLPAEDRDAAFSAGLLHDVGKIVLAKMKPQDYKKALELAETLDAPVYEAELALFGISHDEVGAHLLEAWGFPLSIVEAVGYHHHELSACCSKLSPLSIVAVANSIYNGVTAEQEEPFRIEEFEEELLSQLNDSSGNLWRGLHRAFE